MNEKRRAMDEALKKVSVPLLRDRGFKGAFPHLYREVGSHVDLLMFQFRLDGSSFVVEISYADPDRRNVSFRPETTVKKLQVPATRDRYRLGFKGRTVVDGEWLQLDHGLLTTQARHFNRLALRVNELVLEEAEPWWQSKRAMAPNNALERTRNG
jgi:Domain of unknown function (DUF4304)